MKNPFLKFFIVTICLIVVSYVVAWFTVTLDKSMLRSSGYEYIEYINGSYKVYDKETKVVYIYSQDSHVFTPVYNSDGSLMLYNQ